MTERRQQVTKYILELLKVYGRRPIIIKKSNEGPVCVIARTFVTRQLAQFSMPFPFDDLLTTEKKHENGALDQNKLTVIFNLALIDFKDAYLEDMCDDNPAADRFVSKVEDSIFRTYDWLNTTFETYDDVELIPFLDANPVKQHIETEEDNQHVSKAKEQLAEWGHNAIVDYNDINKILWDCAYHHTSVSKYMKEAMLCMTDDKRLRSSINSICRSFNSFIQSRLESPEVSEKNEMSVKALVKEHNIEMNQLRHDLKKECNQKIQRIRESYKNVKSLKRLAKKLIGELEYSETSFFKSFDLTDIDDVMRYIRWFALCKKKIPNSTLRRIEDIYADRKDDLIFFRASVEAHNEKYAKEEVTETEESTDSLDTELSGDIDI